MTRAVQEQGYDVVFGGGDDWMAALAAYRDSLPTCVAHPRWSTVAAGLDKVGLAERAAQVGLAAPMTEDATDRALSRWRGPVVVKCRSHWQPGQSHRERMEAKVYPTSTAALPRVRLLRASGFEPVLQEPVDGRLGALIGLMHEGRLLGRVQQETDGLWPTPSGVSSRARTVPVDEGLAECATRLLNNLGWSGLVELQFLWDSHGVPHLIDLNGRFYGSMALADAAGAKFIDGWACQALGRPLPPLKDGRPGVRFVWGAGDRRRAVSERRGGLARDVVSTLRQMPGATRSVWRRDDPGPTRDLLLSRLRRGAPDVVPYPRQADRTSVEHAGR